MASKFTPETRGVIIERTAAGVSLADISTALDIRLPTLKGWLTRGRREESGQYHDFAQAIESARDEAKARPEPMDEDELLHVVSETARKGSVAAMKLRWEMICAHRQPAEAEEPQADPLAAVDELAARRAA
jgi:IS30 family transposase